MIKLTVNGRSVELKAGSTLLDAAGVAGVYVPALCHYPRLPSHAVCRMCLVNVKGEPRPQPACVTEAKEGDVVETDSSLEHLGSGLTFVIASQKSVLIVNLLLGFVALSANLQNDFLDQAMPQHLNFFCLFGCMSAFDLA